jgi:N-acetylglucosaminyldiphosphoundecaprenol N-acetyl-beta-D-mannosaminyltransferase
VSDDFLGYALYEHHVDDCAHEIIESALSGSHSCEFLACLNPHSYAVARDDKEFRRALGGARWLVADGVGIVLGARLLGLRKLNRTPGPDVFFAVMARMNSRGGGSVFFLGSSEDTLDKIEIRVRETWPNIRVCGAYSPPFKSELSPSDTSSMIAAINKASPDLLWVGMTAPKQEKWLSQNRDRLQVGAAGAIGAAFDFFAGTVKRPPSIIRNLGLEWLFRLIKEPTRLWRRTLFSAPIYFKDIIFVIARQGLKGTGMKGQ